MKTWHVDGSFPAREGQGQLIEQRNDLLARLEGRLAECTALAGRPTLVRISLSVDESGSVSILEHHSEPLSNDAAKCAEQLVLRFARFDGQSEPRMVELHLSFDPGS